MPLALRPYLAVSAARFRALLQYRAAAIAGFGTQLFWGLLRIAIFTAFYRSTNRPQPLPLADMVSYIWLSQAMFALAMWNVDTDVRGMIRSGTVAYEMLRPLDLYGLWFSRALAARIAPTLLRAIPMFLVAGLFFDLHAPPTIGALLAWVLATCGAFALAAAFSTLLTITLLYTVSGDGISRLAPTVMYIFSGLLIPIPLMPTWAQPVVNFLPFRAIMDTPFRLYTGNIPLSRLPATLLHQVAWMLVLIWLGRLLLRHATRRLIVQGG